MFGNNVNQSKTSAIFGHHKLQFFSMGGTEAPRSSIRIFSDREQQTAVKMIIAHQKF